MQVQQHSTTQYSIPYTRAVLLKAFFHQVTFFQPTFTCQYQSPMKLIQVKYSKMVQNQPKQHFSHLAKAECSAMSKKVIKNLSCQTQRQRDKFWLWSNASAKFLGQFLWPDALAQMLWLWPKCSGQMLRSKCFGPNALAQILQPKCFNQMLWPNSLAKYFGKMFKALVDPCPWLRIITLLYPNFSLSK